VAANELRLLTERSNWSYLVESGLLVTHAARFQGISESAVGSGSAAMLSKRSEWTRATGAAFAALESGCRAEAADLWMSIWRDVEAGGASVPLRAAARNNAGFARILIAEPREALHDFEQAAAQWAAARELLDATELDVAGRSSVFHLRLAMNRPDAFEAVGRRRLERLCVAAAAISHANARLMRGESAHSGTLAVMMTEAFGAGGASTAVVRHAGEDRGAHGGAYSCYRRTAERLVEEHASSHLTGSDYGADLEHAANLTILIHASSVPSEDLGT
jgi:hypothetical protein